MIKQKADNYLKTRGLIFFLILICINIIALLPITNIYVDILSHFKLQYIIIELVFLVLFVYLSIQNKKFVIFSIVSLMFIGINFYDARVYFGKPPINTSNNSIKLALFNVLTQNDNYNLLTRRITAQNPEVIILQEIDNNWLKNTAQIKKEYPYCIEYPRDDNFGIALYSKFPFNQSKVEFWTDYRIPVVTAEIKIHNKNIWIYGIHTLPPTGRVYFKMRNEMLEKIETIVKKHQNKGVIFAGDLNTTVYSVSYKKYIKKSGLADAQVNAKTIRGTWNAKHIPFLRIPLEHVLLTPDLKSSAFTIGSDFGSDHLPVFVDLGF